MQSDEAYLRLLWYRLFLRPLKHEGTSMLPTIGNGDRIFTSKVIDRIERGDIVVFYYPQDISKSFVKRVIGLPGETIEMDNSCNVTINGRILQEPYVSPERNQAAHVRWNQVRREYKYLQADHYFVMGDNRDASNDSRTWGSVAKELIYGKYIGRYWRSGK
jgi:signal peptidase I